MSGPDTVKRVSDERKGNPGNGKGHNAKNTIL
jgi:hypothetical protein